MTIKDKLQILPSDPGVYLMLDEAGEIIYVGKASSLKKRVSSYFTPSKQDVKTAVLVKSVADIDYVVTASEIEALILENNLIKKHQPRFNVRLKDDKRYPYIAVTLSEPYPRVIFTRRIKKSEDRYFGPYTDAHAARSLVSLVNRTFKLKTCTRPIPLKRDERPCLNYQMKRCHGQCLGIISREEYFAIIHSAIKFLEGDIEPVLADLRELMKRYAANLEYEKAARVRDVVEDIVRLSSGQTMDLPSVVNQDFIGVRIERGEGLVLLFEFRKGIMLGKKIRIFENAHYETTAELLRRCIIEQYETSEPPSVIVCSERISDGHLIEEYFTTKSHSRVTIRAARTKEENAVLSLITRNLDVIIAERAQSLSNAGLSKARQKALAELRDVLHLPVLPDIIECFDISNIQGKHAVASMVQFRGGIPEKSSYRRYRIRGYDHANDPGMMHEVVARRLAHCLNEGELPHLLVVDGGPTQLAKALEAAKALAADVPIVSLAKRFEEMYYAPNMPPVRLPENSPALTILKQIRDEAHRFAISYHRNIRGKEAVQSKLDGVEGIGKEKRKALFRHFKSIAAMRAATLDELKEVPGIGEETARAIKEFFRKLDDGNS